MTSNPFCDHAWEQYWSSEEQWMECAKCGKTGQIGLFQHIDFDKLGTPPVPVHIHNRGVELPAGLSHIVNRAPKPKRTYRKGGFKPVVKVRKYSGPWSTYWKTTCELCKTWQVRHVSWAAAYRNADHHARGKHAPRIFETGHNTSPQGMNYQGIPIELGEPELDDENNVAYVQITPDMSRWSDAYNRLQELKE